MIPTPTYTDPLGRVWKPYSIEFDSPDGVFSFQIMAISFEHADLLVANIQESARVFGELVGVVR